MMRRCEVRTTGRSRWSDECGCIAVTTDRNGSPLCDEHAHVATRSETPNENIKHITWLIRDMLEADLETTKVQVSQGKVAPEYWIEEVDTVAEGLVVRLGDGSRFALMIARIE